MRKNFTSSFPYTKASGSRDGPSRISSSPKMEVDAQARPKMISLLREQESVSRDDKRKAIFRNVGNFALVVSPKRIRLL